MKASSPTLFPAAVSITVVLAAAAGIMLIGSPGAERLHRLDEQRIAALRIIGTQLRLYQQGHKVLPERLDVLNLMTRQLQDPVTKAPYEYNAAGNDAYQLCAVFDTTPDEERENPMTDYGTCQIPWWKHAQGRYCYTVSVKDCK